MICEVMQAASSSMRSTRSRATRDARPRSDAVPAFRGTAPDVAGEAVARDAKDPCNRARHHRGAHRRRSRYACANVPAIKSTATSGSSTRPTRNGNTARACSAIETLHVVVAQRQLDLVPAAFHGPMHIYRGTSAPFCDQPALNRSQNRPPPPGAECSYRVISALFAGRAERHAVDASVGAVSSRVWVSGACAARAEAGNVGLATRLRMCSAACG